MLNMHASTKITAQQHEGGKLRKQCPFCVAHAPLRCACIPVIPLESVIAMFDFGGCYLSFERFGRCQGSDGQEGILT